MDYQKKEKQRIEKLIKNSESIKQGYPEEHPERVKIDIMIDDLKKKLLNREGKC